MHDLYQKVSVAYDQEYLRSTYLSKWNFPPSEAKDVIVISDYTTLVIGNYANLDWGIDFKEMQVEDIGVYITKAGYFANPHTDGSSTGKIREWALNFPLFNCEKGYTTWHSYSDINTQTISDDKMSGTIYNKTNLKPSMTKELGRIRMNGSYMVKTNILHSIDNRDNQHPRAVLTFRFKDISWEQGKKVLCQ